MTAGQGVIDLFAAILSRRGAEVTAVDTVREGLAAARRVRPDVIRV